MKRETTLKLFWRGAWPSDPRGLPHWLHVFNPPVTEMQIETIHSNIHVSMALKKNKGLCFKPDIEFNIKSFPIHFPFGVEIGIPLIQTRSFFQKFFYNSFNCTWKEKFKHLERPTTPQFENEKAFAIESSSSWRKLILKSFQLLLYSESAQCRKKRHFEKKIDWVFCNSEIAW